MRCSKCNGKLTCAKCSGRKGGQAKVRKGFAVTGGAREAVLRRWALQREADAACAGQVEAALKRWAKGVLDFGTANNVISLKDKPADGDTHDESARD